jgi:hypothetical protein
MALFVAAAGQTTFLRNKMAYQLWDGHAPYHTALNMLNNPN